MNLKQEIARRRTFAIISHPDAGKTTLTEKFLLYGGAVKLAGSVSDAKTKSTRSDWMELEKKRGISVSSTVLQFEYNGYVVNLLDTPGHKDFSEDTYRVLTAVDAVIMIIDAGKGIEAQTRKLFEICKRREIPIFTLMNKLDRPTKEPIDLLDELENVLGINAYPVNWPLGTGPEFKGVYDRTQEQVHLFERVPGGAYKAAVAVKSISDPTVKNILPEHVYKTVVDELDMLEGAGFSFDHEAISKGKLTPVFFGSASNNFGIQFLLDEFLKYASEPLARKAGDKVIPTDHESFSGFIFKIQANMDPKHRDRIAFIRICSGKFTRDMTVIHARTGRKLRLSSSHKLFGQDRETVDEAFAGDIIGVIGHTDIRIGDTLTEDKGIVYNEIPHFTPEFFAYLHNAKILNSKRFNQGFDQLLQEGVIQALYPIKSMQRVPILAAVGQLQFEVVQYRLESEYGAESRLEMTKWNLIRWVPKDTKIEDLKLPSESVVAQDTDNNNVILFPGEWAERSFVSQNPDINLIKEPI